MKLQLFLCTFVLFGVAVDCVTEKKWRPVSVLLKRAILASSKASRFLEVTYIRLLKAWENVEVSPFFVILLIQV